MDLSSLTDLELLKVKIKDLPVDLSAPLVSKGIIQLRRDFQRKGLSFQPHIWVSDDWFCPDGVCGFAVPFFILHPRLIELEKKMMGHCEGERYGDLLKLLRHESGHAVDNAYKMRKLEGRVDLFGNHNLPYPKSYEYRPYSKKYVKHIKPHYAQAHPDEDFAETFAIYLGPKKEWSEHYKNTVALKKLHFIDRELKKVKKLAPLLKGRRRVDPIEKDNRTLGSYYRQKIKQQRVKEFFFSKRGLPKTLKVQKLEGARSTFFSPVEKEIIKMVAKQTNGPQYRVKGMINQLKSSLRQNGVMISGSRLELKKQMVKYLVEHSSSYFKNGEHRVIM